MAHIIKSFAVGSYKSTLKHIMQHPELGIHLQELVVNRMNTECQIICKVSSDSILRATPLEFNVEKFRAAMLPVNGIIVQFSKIISKIFLIHSYNLEDTLNRILAKPYMVSFIRIILR